jgi:hypothetical protein
MSRRTRRVTVWLRLGFWTVAGAVLVALAGLLAPWPARAETKCRVYADIFQNPFLFGEPPDFVGFVTDRQQRFRAFAEKPGIHAWHAAILAENATLLTGEAESTGQQVYLAYRRASLDHSGAPIPLIECPQARNFFFDILQAADPTGFSDFLRWIGEQNLRAFYFTERMALEATITYKLSVHDKARAQQWKAADASPHGGKLKMPHPDEPKILVLQAVTPLQGLRPGFYDFTLTAEVSLRCAGPFIFCGALQIKSYVDLFGKLRKGGVEGVLAGKILKAYRSVTGLSTTAEEATKKVLKESARNVWRNASLRRYHVTPFEAKAEVQNVLVPAVVPDVVGRHKCEAARELQASGLQMTIQAVPPLGTQHEWVRDTNPGPGGEARPGSPVTVMLAVDRGSEPTRCGLGAVFKAVRKDIGP